MPVVVRTGDPEGTDEGGVRTRQGGFYSRYAGRIYPGRPHGIELAPKHLELLSDPEQLENALLNYDSGGSPANTIETLRILAKIFSPTK